MTTSALQRLDRVLLTPHCLPAHLQQRLQVLAKHAHAAEEQDAQTRAHAEEVGDAHTLNLLDLMAETRENSLLGLAEQAEQARAEYILSTARCA